MYFLNDSDREIFEAVVEAVLGRIQDHHGDQPEGRFVQTPDNHIFKIPSASNSIPARVGTTMGSLADCEVYKYNSSGVLEIATGVKYKVWNPYLCKLYRQAAPYFMASRNKYGLWICEKPRLWHKAKVAGADIDPGGSGTCNLWFNGAVSTGPETVTAHLNWMASAEKVSDANEIMVHFAEDEDKWWISNSECEVAI